MYCIILISALAVCLKPWLGSGPMALASKIQALALAVKAFTLTTSLLTNSVKALKANK